MSGRARGNDAFSLYASPECTHGLRKSARASPLTTIDNSTGHEYPHFGGSPCRYSVFKEQEEAGEDLNLRLFAYRLSDATRIE